MSEKEKVFITPILSKYFQAKTTMDLIYKNGGIVPANYGVVAGESFGSGLDQEGFLLLLYFYGGFMLLAQKDPQEAETMIEEIGQALIDNYSMNDESKKWIQEKFIEKKKNDSTSTLHPGTEKGAQ
jgi:hypothetical protein